MAVAGGYTYLRNAWTVGNPLYPLPLHLGPWHLPGWTESTLAFRRTLPEFAIDPLRFLLANDVLTGRVFVVTLLPAAVLAPLLRLWPAPPPAAPPPRRGRPDAASSRPSSSPCRRCSSSSSWSASTTTATCATSSPPSPSPPPASPGCSTAWRHADRRCTAPCSPAPPSSPSRSSSPATAWRSARGRCSRPPWPRPAAPPRLARPRLRRRRVTHASAAGGRRSALAAAALLALLVAAGLAAAPVAERYAADRYAGDPVVQALAEAAPEGTTVAVVGGNRWYPLFGAHLQNRVLVVPRHGPLTGAFYTWGGDTGFPFDDGDFQAWRRNLAAAGVHWIVLHPDQGDEPIRSWMKAEHHHFHRVATGAERELWYRGRGGLSQPCDAQGGLSQPPLGPRSAVLGPHPLFRLSQPPLGARSVVLGLTPRCRLRRSQD